ncbi:restriction endonuclease subunit R, partial [Myxococcota bacterium]|nr:restriction endonuclease subunit R [Myxococcota bacterium]
MKTQRRVIRLLQRSLGYEYLGDWHNSDHAPIERPVFVEALKARGVADPLLPDTMRQLSEAAKRAVGPQGDGGAAFLQALLHGVRVRASALDEPVRVMPIDWNHPE